MLEGNSEKTKIAWPKNQQPKMQKPKKGKKLVEKKPAEKKQSTLQVPKPPKDPVQMEKTTVLPLTSPSWMKTPICVYVCSINSLSVRVSSIHSSPLKKNE